MLVANMTRQITGLVSSYKDHTPKGWDLSSVSIQERAFTQWCNLFLKSKGFEIDSLLDLQDGVCVIILLEIVSGRNLYDIEVDYDENEVSRNWRIILKYLEEENIKVPECPDTVTDEARKIQLLVFIVWHIILRYQLYDNPGGEMKLKELDYKRASQSLMRWVQSKMPNYSISNFTSDWTDGVAFCLLVNAIRPDTIPVSMFRHTNNPEMNVRLACTTAEDELGIPELIAHYDIANGKADEKSIMTYVALFRSADRMIKRGIKTKTYTSDVSITSESESESANEPRKKTKYIKAEGIPYQPARCVAFGAGLRWGQVGKPAEFIVRLNGAEASDLSVSIECRPYDHRAALYKPELQIKPICETSYIVRYTPTRPGEYVLSIFCGGDHIPNSPFRLDVQETVLLSKQYRDDEIIISLDPSSEPLTVNVLTKSLDSAGSVSSKHDSAFADDDSLSSMERNSPPLWLDKDSHDLYTKLAKFIKPENSSVTAYGTGLHVGEVGLVASFNVTTPNTDKGPLSVSITCPAMSLPVPCVKTKLQPTSLVHDVLYVPTEPGVYEIDVRWGEKEIPGSPFRLAVGDSVENNVQEKEFTNSHGNKLQLYRLVSKQSIFLYYSASSKSLLDHHNKSELENVLRKENPFDKLFTIPVDIELSSAQRNELFEKADSRVLPIVFVNDKYIGNFNDLMRLYRKGNLKTSMMQKVENMKHTFSRLSSYSN